MAEPPDPTLNHEAIPAQQPIAASPLPDTGQRRERSRGGPVWALALTGLLLVSLIFALIQNLR